MKNRARFAKAKWLKPTVDLQTMSERLRDLPRLLKERDEALDRLNQSIVAAEQIMFGLAPCSVRVMLRTPNPKDPKRGGTWLAYRRFDGRQRLVVEERELGEEFEGLLVNAPKEVRMEAVQWFPTIVCALANSPGMERQRAINAGEKINALVRGFDE